jgi:hypothetical protein
MVAAELYQYRPLAESDGIRLLVLQPAISRNAQVSGRLIHTMLKESCDEVIDHTTALSYA